MSDRSLAADLAIAWLHGRHTATDALVATVERLIAHHGAAEQVAAAGRWITRHLEGAPAADGGVRSALHEAAAASAALDEQQLGQLHAALTAADRRGELDK